MEKEKEENNHQKILDQDFFDTIKNSKKINSKIKKMNELTESLKKTPNFLELPDIKSKMSDLYSLLLTNLNENNNNYVLSQMELIKALVQTINKEESFKNFVKQSLGKLFDKFYLGNVKINESLIEIFEQYISFKILAIKDYYQYIENIPLEEEEDSYRMNIINFLYESIKKDESVLLNNIPKAINELIKKLINDNESDISEISSKILNVLINRDIESNKKKDQEKEENNNENKEDSSASTSNFVKKIVSAIKQENDKDESLNKIDNKENEKKNESEEKKIEEKKEEKVEEIKVEKNEEKNEEKIEEKKEEVKVEEKKEEKPEEKKVEEKKEEKVEEKKEEKVEEKKEEKVEEKKEEKVEEKKEEKVEEKKVEEKKEEKKEEPKQEEKISQEVKEENKKEEKEKKDEEKNNIEIKGTSDSNTNVDKKEEKNEKVEDKKETDKKGKKGGVKRTSIKSQISKFRKNMKNKKKTDGFEFELVETKKDKEKDNQAIPEEKPEEIKKEEVVNNNPEADKAKVEEKKDITENKEKESAPVKEEKKEEPKKEEPKKEEVKIEPKKEEPKKEEPKKEEPKKEETKKEEVKVEPKKEEPKTEEVKVEPKKEEPKKEEKKVEPKKEKPKKVEKKIEPKKEEIKEEKKEENIENNDNGQAESSQKPNNIIAANQQSLNEFERKLQLALEQEEKEGLLNKNNENLTDINSAPVKQKKEDPKFDEIKSVLGKEIVDSLFSPKWEQKKHGFELINEFVNSKPQGSYNLGDLIEYMKLKLKNYKETNFNINREAINIYVNMIKKKIISKDQLVPIIIAYHEKLADIKLKDNLIELINSSFDLIEPSNILKQIISKISKKNNSKLLIEYSTFLGNVVEEYDVKDLPNKDIIEFCKVLANNSNPQVRTSAISLLCILYKYLGKDVKTLTRDIKESTLKLIDAELDKVTVIDPKESAAKKKKVASTAGEGKSATGGGGGDLIPPQDISKKITPKMIKDLNGKWAEKKEACDSIEKILTGANMRILPNGLNNLMTAFKKKLSDSNKNFVKMIVSLLAKFIEALKQGFKQWAKPIALALIPNLADKNQLMRNECQNCFDKWVEFAGFDCLVVHFPQFLKTDNVEMRIEIMNFFIKYKDKFNKSNGELVYKDMMNPLLICLQDRSSNVRNAAEEIIKSSLTYIPIHNYYQKSEDFKPAITKTLKQILDKIKRETENSAPQENSNKEPENNQEKSNSEANSNSKNADSSNSIPTFNTKKSKGTSRTNVPKVPSKNVLNDTQTTSETNLDSEKSETTTEDTLNNYNTVANIPKATTTKKTDKKNSGTINVKRTKPKRKLSEDDLVNPLGTAMNKQMPASSVSHLASNSTILKNNEKKSFQKNVTTMNVNSKSAVFLMNVKVIPSKTKRYDKDKRTKFSLDTVSKDYFNKLKDQCKGLFLDEFSKKIFSDDFRKQVEAFKEMKNQIDKKINIPIYFDNLDLILKIIGIKIMNNLNPTLMKNFFEFLDSLYSVIFENKYKLNETESNIIISILIDKLSLNNNTLKEYLFTLLDKYIEYMDPNKIMVNVLYIALNKNSKIKIDILNYTLELTENQTLNIVNKTYAKLFCKFLPLENAIKSIVVKLFQEIYNKMGDELFNVIEISEKDKEYLEENLLAEDEEEEEEEEEELNNEDGNGNVIHINKNEIDNNNNTISNKTSNKNIPTNNSDNTPANKNDKADDLFLFLNSLFSKDQTEKLNAIVNIHELICGKFEQNKEKLISNIDEIITVFRKVSDELFLVKDLKTIPVKFAKYLAIVLCKLTSNKELISNLNYEVLLDLSRQLLRYLLINGLDKIGENQEGNIIFKSINSTMLRILENCDTTSVILALLELIKEFQEKEDKNLINLAAKCLLKTTQNLKLNIDNIKIDKVLLQIHLLLLTLQKKNQDSNKKNHNNLVINTVKNMVEDFVKLKKDKILEEYSKSVKNHEINDKYILNWIKSMLEKKEKE